MAKFTPAVMKSTILLDIGNNLSTYYELVPWNRALYGEQRMNNLTWHCELVFRNDEECAGVADCLTTHVMNHVYHDYQGRAYEDQRKARIYILSEFIRNYVEEAVDAGNEYKGYNPMTWEIIVGALQEIDFRQIAEDMIGDYSPKPAEEIAESEEYFQIKGFGNYDIDED